MSLVTAAYAGEPAHDSSPPENFFAGNYLVIGQQPDGANVYKGSAHIDMTGNTMHLTRKINGIVTTAEGTYVRKAMRRHLSGSPGKRVSVPPG